MDKLAELLPVVATAVTATLGFLFVVVVVVKRFVHLCKPNEILIFSGRNHVTPDGRSVGYRVIFGGRGFKWPYIEEVQRLDMSLISVPMTVQGAYSEGGIPLAVHAIANIKVSSKPAVVGNAIERFLGRSGDIRRVAKETLEGHLRGVLAEMTPEEVNEDRLKFANQLKDHAGDDLAKLGLQLDTLKIQHVSDERNYLESIGRKRIAEILSEAEVAESDAQRSAQESEAAAHAMAEVAKTNARAMIQAKENALRQRKAELDAEAQSAEERAKASAEQARAEAEQDLQRIRGELEQLRLAADVTIPAQVDRKVCELLAAGEAARISADGEAQAQALAAIADAWSASDGRAMDMYVLQHLDEIFGQVASAARKLEVGEVNLVDGGDGSTLPAYLAAYPATMSRLLAEVSSTIGVDVNAVLKGETVPDAPSNGAAARGIPASSRPPGLGPAPAPAAKPDSAARPAADAVSSELERRPV